MRVFNAISIFAALFQFFAQFVNAKEKSQEVYDQRREPNASFSRSHNHENTSQHTSLLARRRVPAFLQCTTRDGQ
jgi:hypothetical protein